MFFIIGIFMAITLIVLLILKKNTSQADRVLGLWLAVIGVHLGYFYAVDSGKIVDFPWLLGMDFSLPLVQGVFLYFYARSLTGPSLRIREIALHLLPSLLLILVGIPFYALSADTKIAIVMRGEDHAYEWFDWLQDSSMLVSGFSYSLAVLFLVKKHKKRIENSFSNTENKTLNWLRNLTLGLIGIWLVVLFSDNPVFIFSGVVVFVLYLGFYGINQTTIFSSAAELENELSSSIKDDVTEKQYKKSGLKREVAAVIYARLKDLMHTDKLYLEPELTLGELAARLETTPNYVSQIINEYESKSFYQYINALRVEEFLVICKRPEYRSYTILAMAMECGFKSKSTFNKHFKEITGKTPRAILIEKSLVS